MKKVYMIWEDGWGNTGIFFEDEIEANKFASLKNNYSVKSFCIYENINDYKNNKKDNYIIELKKAIEEKEKEIYKFEAGKDVFVTISDELYKMNTKNIEDVLNKKSSPIIFIKEVTSFDNNYYEFFEYNRKFINKNLYLFVAKYEEELEKYQQNKKLLKEFKQEYLELMTNFKEEQNELTK